MFVGPDQNIHSVDQELIEVEAPGGDWGDPIGWGLVALASLGFLIFAAPPSSLGILLGLIAVFTSGYAGYGSWRLGGRVVIGDGFVRVYGDGDARPQVLKLEAPYSAFRKLMVSHRQTSEKIGPLVTVDLLHEVPKKPTIGLYAYQAERLEADDRSIIDRIAARMNIPIDVVH